MDKIIEQAKKGDQLALEKIVAQYKGLIRAYANKFYLTGGDKDDLLQEGMLGLFYAVTYYDEDKGSFPSFVRLCVLRQILDAIRSDGGVKNRPLNNYVNIDEAKDFTDGSTPLEILIEKEYAEKINFLIDTKLTPSEQRVLRLFAEGFSYDDIAKQTNKSYKAIDGALQRARKKLLAKE